MNISISGENISLSSGVYIVIDGLYLNNIKDHLKSKRQNNKLSLSLLKSKVFPYTTTPFAVIELEHDTVFNLENLQKVDNDALTEKNLNEFMSCDTGLLLFIRYEILSEFVKEYDFDKLIESTPIDYKYWQLITAKFKFNDLSLILSPGIKSGFEFDGSGLYHITL